MASGAVPPESAVIELINLLQATLNPDSKIRKDAEKRLSDLEANSVYVSSLVYVLSAPNVSPVIQQAASVYFKNLVRRAWDPTHIREAAAAVGANAQEQASLTQDDKKAIRENLLEMMVASPLLVRTQLAETLKSIVSYDFPHAYPTLVPSVMANLTSGQPNRLDAALLALRNITKVYEFKPKTSVDGGNPRAPLDRLVEVTFPTLLQLMAPIQNEIAKADEAGDREGCRQWIMREKLVYKIFWSSTQFRLPPFIITHNDHFAGWVQVLLQSWTRPVRPELAVDLQDSDLLLLPEWKVKKWIGHILHRFLQRYGDPKRVTDDDDPQMPRFARAFLDTYASHITAAVLDLLAWPHSKQIRLSPRVANLALNYVDAAISPAKTYAVLQPHMGLLLSNILFPYLCMTEEDLELWEDDPVEYVRKTSDILEDFYSPRSAACAVLYTLSQLRPQKTIMPFLAFLSTILAAYQAAPSGSPQKKELARQKDGVLMAVGNIKEKLLSTQDLHTSLRQMLEAHVHPEFQSEFPFLRARACWLYGQMAMADIDFYLMVPGLLLSTLDGILGLLGDQGFPVRVQAAMDIRHFLSNPSAQDVILPILPRVLDQVCSLIDEVDNTDIVATIESIVERFSNHIAPFASTLCAKLGLAFLRASNMGEEEEEASLAAVQCVQAMQAVLQSLAEKHEDPRERAMVMRALEPQILPVFQNMFVEDRMDFFEDLLELLSLLVYFSGGQGTDISISQELWSLYPQIFDAFNDWAFDFYTNLVPPIDNFISNDTAGFLVGSRNGVSYVQMVYDMIMRLWEEAETEDEATEGTKLAEVLVLNCIGRIDPVIVSLLPAVIQKLRTAESLRLKVLLLSNVAACLYYNVELTLKILEENLSMTQQVFALWLSLLDSFERVHDKKLTLLALSSLFKVSPDKLPASVRNGMNQLLHFCLVLTDRIRTQREEKATIAEKEGAGGVARSFLAANGGNFAFASNSQREFEDTEDADEDDIDLKYLQHVAQEAGIDLDKLAASNPEDDDDDVDDFFDLDDEGEFDTAIDNLDEAAFFKECLSHVPVNDIQQLLKMLPESDGPLVQAILGIK